MSKARAMSYPRSRAEASRRERLVLLPPVKEDGHCSGCGIVVSEEGRCSCRPDMFVNADVRWGPDRSESTTVLAAPRAATEPLPADYDPTGVGEEFTQDGPRSLYAVPPLTRERLAAALHITGHQQAEYLILGTEGCAGCSIRASKALAALTPTSAPEPGS